MISIDDVVIGGLLPAVAAALALWAAWRITGNASAAWAAGLVLGYLTGHWGIEIHGAGLAAAARRALHPHEARDWLPPILLLLVVAEIVALAGLWGRTLAWLLRVAGCALLPWRLVSLHRDYPASELVAAGLNEGAWSWGEVFLSVGGMVAGLLAVWRLALSARGLAAPGCRSLLATIVAFGSAATIGLSGSLTTAQLLAVAAAAVGGSGGAAQLLRIGSGPEAAPGPVLATVGGLLLLAHLFVQGGVSVLTAVLLMVSLTAALAALPRTETISVRRQIVLRLAICLVPLIVAVTLAGMEFARGPVQHVESSTWSPAETLPRPRAIRVGVGRASSRRPLDADRFTSGTVASRFASRAWAVEFLVNHGCWRKQRGDPHAGRELLGAPLRLLGRLGSFLNGSVPLDCAEEMTAVVASAPKARIVVGVDHHPSGKGAQARDRHLIDRYHRRIAGPADGQG